MAVLTRSMALIWVALAASCGGGGGGGESDGGNVVGSARMAPAVSSTCGYDHVYVTVEKVLVDAGVGSTESILPAPRRIDLMGLSGGVFAALGMPPLAVGHYAQVRLVLVANSGAGMANAVLPTGASPTPLSTPSAQQSGLKLQADFDVAAGRMADLLPAFEPCEAVTAAGNSGRYLLAPVLAVQPVDVTPIAKGEFRVNTTTAGDQSFPALAALANAGYVVAWMSQNPGGDGWSVYVQRYDRTGAPLGGEVLVAQGTAADGGAYPRVAGLNNGGFVVVWSSNVPPGVHSRRFDDTGAAVGSAMPVNASTATLAITPSVAALAGDGYLVTWSADFASILAQRFDNGGGPVGSATTLNLTSGGAWQSAVAALSDGGYAAAWGLLPVEGGPPDVYARRFDKTGAPVGSETRANTYTADAQQVPAIAGLVEGGYVVTWMSQFQDGSGYGIYGRRFGADGTPLGGETRINTTTAGSQESPAIAGLSGGGYVVAWQSDGDIQAQRFDGSGAPWGGETRVNSTTGFFQSEPAITALADGGYVVTWASYGQDGSANGIYAQQFDAQGLPQ